MTSFIEPYDGSPAYERRVVAFYDVLGWKGHVSRAGSDPAKLAELNLVTTMLSAFERERVLGSLPGAQISTFSDNVVMSTPYSVAAVENAVSGLARAQLALALPGFLLRGAITVGDLYHTEHAVFGPGLVRAHHLESKIAVYPRILIDAAAPELTGIDGDLIEHEGGLLFLDSFSPNLVEELLGNQIDVSGSLGALEAALGAKLPDYGNVSISGPAYMESIMTVLSAQMIEPMREHDWRKLAWLFDRIAVRIGSVERSEQMPRQTLEVA